MIIGRIIEGRGGIYTIRDENGKDFILRAKKHFRHEGMVPLVGDRVSFTPGNLKEHGWLEQIFPRSSLSVRPPVANITQLVIVLAPEPEPDFLLADKLLVFASRQNIMPLIAVNKSELNPNLAREIQETYSTSGIKVLAVSAETGEGLEPLRKEMTGHQSCFAGQSGAGKSTLISRLTGRELETGEISRRIHRGKQTTRHITLIEAQGLCVLDTPGFSLLELPDDLQPEQLCEHYPEFRPFGGQCRFNPCLHDREPDCAVQKASLSNEISPLRLSRYRILLETTRENWSRRYD